jgi:Na+/alanine symporter
VGSLSHGYLATQDELNMCLGSLLMTFVSMYVMFFALGLLTTIVEREHIYAHKKWRVVSNLFTFPLFMFTYIPMTVIALFKKVEWVPTKHDIAVNFDEVVNNAQ